MTYTIASSRAVSKPVWHIPLPCVQRKTPDDWQRNCPKHVEFYIKNKFEKLVTLVGFIIRTYHDARSPESQISVRIFIDYRIPLFPNTLTFPESTMLHQDNVTVRLSEKHVPQIYLQVQNTLFVLINRNKIFSFYSSLSSNSILSYDVSICRLYTIRFLISVTK